MKKSVLILALLVIALALPINAFAVNSTYDIAADQDDGYAQIRVGGATDDNKTIGFAAANFGRYAAGGLNYDSWAYFRWDVDIPKGSTIVSSHVTGTSYTGITPTFNTTIWGLDITGNPSWQNSNGFNTTNYANGTALNAISVTSASASWAISSAWTGGSTYDTPDLTAIIQEMVDNADYDPDVAGKGYIGIKIDDGDGGYYASPNWQFRAFWAYFHGSDYAQLDVTYLPPQDSVIIRR